MKVVYAIGIVAALWVLVLVLVSLTALTYQTLQLTGVMR